jgi:hypothetical protein
MLAAFAINRNIPITREIRIAIRARSCCRDPEGLRGKSRKKSQKKHGRNASGWRYASGLALEAKTGEETLGSL